MTNTLQIFHAVRKITSLSVLITIHRPYTALQKRRLTDHAIKMQEWLL